MRSDVTRLGFTVAVAVVLVVTACAPASPPAQPTTAPAAPTAAPAKPAANEEKPAAKAPAAADNSQAEMDKLLAAAKSEGGNVSIVTHPSNQWKGWVPVFEKRF